MKKFSKMLVLALALVVAMSMGAGSTAEAAKKYVKKVAAVDSLSGKKKITLTTGKKAKLKTTVTATKKKYAKKKYYAVTYKTSNKKIATVNKKGAITAKKKVGTAKITVTSKYNKKKATVTVKVVKGKVTSVQLNKDKAEVHEGATEALTPTVKTKGKKPNKTLVWKSSNEEVATVSSKGVVTAKKAGEAVITATATDGTKKAAKCTVTVQAAYTTVTPVDGKEASVDVVVDNKDLDKLQADLDKVAAFSSDKKVTVTLNGKSYDAEIKDGKVYIGGKLLKDSEQAKKATSVKVTAKVDSKKLVSVVAFTPSAVTSVTVGKVKFEKITDKTFTIGTTEYEYTVEKNGTITVKGDAKTALDLGDVAKVEVIWK